MSVASASPLGPSSQPADLRFRSAALAYLFAAGATLVVVALVLPKQPAADSFGLGAVALAAYVTAAFLFFARRVLPGGVHQAFLALGTVLASLVVLFTGDGSTAFAMFYIWVSIYAFYFFSRSQAAAQVALAALAYAIVLTVVEDATDPVARWIIALATMVVTGTLIARLVSQVRSQASEMAAIADVSRDLAGVTTAAAARPAICAAALELADAKVVVMFEPEPKGLELVSTAIAGPHLESPIHLPYSGEPSGVATTFASGEPLFVSDLESHTTPSQRLVEHFGVVSGFWQPVLRNGLPIGVIVVAWGDRIHELTARVRALIAVLAGEAAVAIERADMLTRLETVARTDDLTGLANRRALDEHLDRELARSVRDGRPLCVAMLDLDLFKDFNDEHGHAAGDRLLKEVSSRWRDLLRPSDILARYGGEEFVLLLPACDLARGIEVVERLRAETVEDQTCSGGVAVWDGDESAGSLLARADSALYEAKHRGRDRVEIAATRAG